MTTRSALVSLKKDHTPKSQTRSEISDPFPNVDAIRASTVDQKRQAPSPAHRKTIMRSSRRRTATTSAPSRESFQVETAVATMMRLAYDPSTPSPNFPTFHGGSHRDRKIKQLAGRRLSTRSKALSSALQGVCGSQSVLFLPTFSMHCRNPSRRYSIPNHDSLFPCGEN